MKRVRPRDNAEKVKAQALTQAADYLEHLGMAEGWVLILMNGSGVGTKKCGGKR